MTTEQKIEHTSEISQGDFSTQPYRVVLHQNNRGEYVTHLENLDRQEGGGFKPKARRDFYWGHYFTDYNEALRDYTARCDKYSLLAFRENRLA